MNDVLQSEFIMHLREMATRWRVLVAVSLIVGALVFGARVSRPQVYEATAAIRVSLAETGADDGTITDFQTLSLTKLATADNLIKSAISLSGDDRSVSEVRSAISANQQSTPGFVDLTARSPHQKGATDLANAVARVIGDAAKEDPSARSAGATVSLVEAARAGTTVPTVTTATSLAEGLAAALIAAIILGEGLVAWRLVRGGFSPIDPAAEASRLLGAPVMDLRGGAAGGDPFAFFHRHLRDRPILTVIQVGTNPSVEVACRFSNVAADTRRRVVLVDGDLGQPILPEALGQGIGPGTVEVVQGLRSVSSVVRPAGGDQRALVLQVGRTRPSGPSGLQLLDGLKTALREVDADQVIISATSSSSTDEQLQLAHMFPQAVVLVFDPAEITSRGLRGLVERLHGVDARVIAAVATTAEPADSLNRRILSSMRSPAL